MNTPHMKYTRLYADEQGESHFDEIEIELTPTQLVPSAPPMDLSSPSPATQFAFMNTSAGWSSEWHPSAGRSMFFVLSGEWEVTASDGDTRRFVTGDALLAEDTTGKGHTSRVLAESLAAVVQLSP